MFTLFDMRKGELKRFQYIFLFLFLLLPIDISTSTYAILYGTSSMAVLGLCISIYIQILVDSRRFRNMGTSPYFSLIGTTLKICAFIMVLAPMNDIFIHNKNLIVTQDADISVLLRNLYAHLNDLSLFDQMSEITPFLGLYFVALGYVMFLMIIKNLNSKGRRYSATLDHNTNAHNFKGRE